MARLLSKDGIFVHSPVLSPAIPSLLSTPPSSNNISPVLLLVISVLALVIVFLGILHLLYKFLVKSQTSSQIHQSITNPDDLSTSHGLQRQLQQLFRLHDSGLDQTAIDSLPVFYYRDITMGLKEPFDCAVCLCEFSDMDKLRLLPSCSHAFHVYCIDTWLLSNSTCPLCRSTLLGPNPNFDPHTFSFGFSRALDDGREGVSVPSSGQVVEDTAKTLGSKRVFSVRLGKFRSINEREISQSQSQSQEMDLGARRCYSMGTYQYLVSDKDLLVELSPVGNGKIGSLIGGGEGRLVKGNASMDGDDDDADQEGKRIGGRCGKGESFSVSKVWLWSNKKNRLLSGSSSTTPLSVPSCSSSVVAPSLSCNDRTNTVVKL